MTTTNWTCEQIEARLSDYLDGLLQPAERAAFDAHLNTCAHCTELVSSVSGLLSNMQSIGEVEAPPHLVYAILDKTLGPRDAITGWRVVLAWIRGLASPKFAYGAVSVFATFLLVASAAGFSWRKPKLADLKPANVLRNADRQAHLAYARSTKFVSDLRVVYEIQARFSQSDDMPAQENQQSTPQKAPGQTDATPSSPKQQNRANGVERKYELTAAEFPTLSIRRTL
jgi:anti-sigma factor RsiW